MPWATIAQRISGPTTKPASMRLVIRGEGTLPSCVISLRKILGETVTWKHGDPVGLHVGEGEHSGLVRVVHLKKGAPNQIATVRRMNKGGMSFDFGHVPQLGQDEHQKASTDARVIDADTVEVRIPAWDDAEAAGDEEEDEQESRAPVKAATAAPKPTAPACVNGATLVQNKGVELDLTHDEESISFAGKTMELTTRQAAVLAMLLRVMPSPVGRSFIVMRAFADVPPHTRDASLDLVLNDLSKAMDGIGLTLKNRKAVGLSLAIGD